MAKAIPDGYEAAIPYLCCDDAAGAIEFYQRAFGATELMRMPDPNGRIGHAELKIGNAMIMLSDEWPEGDVRSPRALGGSPVAIFIYVEDVDALANQAVAAGATLASPVEDQFYGDRSATLLDPVGHRWYVATHQEDVSPAEAQRRYEATAAGGSS